MSDTERTQGRRLRLRPHLIRGLACWLLAAVFSLLVLPAQQQAGAQLVAMLAVVMLTARSIRLERERRP